MTRRGQSERWETGDQEQLTEFAKRIRISNEVANAVTEALQDPMITVEDEAYIEDSDSKELLGDMEIDGKPLTTAQRGQASRLWFLPH